MLQTDDLQVPPIHSPKAKTSQKDKIKKPARNKSAFIIFSEQARTHNARSYKLRDLNSNEIMVDLALLWKSLDESEREKYETLAKRDKERYLAEKDVFAKMYPDQVPTNKTEKNHVKKPPSAYGLYIQKTKQIIKDENPRLKMADVLRIVARRWKENVSDELKQVYKKEAAKLKEQAKQRKEQMKGNLKKNGNETIKYPKKPFKIIKTDPMRQIQSQVQEFIPNHTTPVKLNERDYAPEISFSPTRSSEALSNTGTYEPDKYCYFDSSELEFQSIFKVGKMHQKEVINTFSLDFEQQKISSKTSFIDESMTSIISEWEDIF